MTSPWPGSEQEQNPGVRLGAHLVSLAGGEVDQTSASYLTEVGTA